MLELTAQLKLPLLLRSSVRIQNIRNEFICIQCDNWIHIIDLSFDELDTCENPQSFFVDKQKVLLKTKVSYILPSVVLNISVTDSTLYLLTSDGVAVQSLDEEIEEENSLEDIFGAVDKHKYDVIKELTEIRYRKCHVQALASIPDELVVCSKDINLSHSAWLVELLHQGHLHPNKKENALFSVSCDMHNFEEDCKNVQFQLDPFENETSSPHYEPILLCIATRKLDIFHSHLHVLKKELFKSLFVDPHSANNVIILLALPDGKIVWYPMKQNFLGDKFSSPYLLCDLSQPIVAMFCSNLKSAQECADSITIIGSEGKIVIFNSVKDKSGYHTLFGHLESSVQSCIMWKNFIIYISLDGQLFGCEISLTEDSEYSFSCHCYKLPISGACAICFVSKGNDAKILCLNSAGHLYTLPFCNFSKDNDAISDSNDFQNALKAISDNAKELSCQQSFIKQQKQILSQLGIALDLAFKTQTVENLPFTMEKVKGQQGMYTLSVDCTALSKLDLNADWWKFVIMVKSKHHTFFCKSTPVDRSSTVHSVLKITQNKVLSSLCPPLLIEYGLQLQFLSFKQEFVKLLRKLDPVYVCIHQDVIDELCFLTAGDEEDNTSTMLQTISSINEMKCKRQHLLKHNILESVTISHLQEMKTSVLFSLQRIRSPVNENVNTDGNIKSQDILIYLVQQSLMSKFQIHSNYLTCYYFGVEVRIEVQNYEEYMQITIQSKDHSVMCKLRKAITFRLKNLINTDKIPSETISLSKTCLVQSQYLYSELCNMTSVDDFTVESLAEIYGKIRRSISQHLPVV